MELVVVLLALLVLREGEGEVEVKATFPPPQRQIQEPQHCTYCTMLIDRCSKRYTNHISIEA